MGGLVVGDFMTTPEITGKRVSPLDVINDEPGNPRYQVYFYNNPSQKVLGRYTVRLSVKKSDNSCIASIHDPNSIEGLDAIDRASAFIRANTLVLY